MLLKAYFGVGVGSLELLCCTQHSSTALLRSPSWKLQGQLTVGSKLPPNRKKSKVGKLSCWPFLVDLKEPSHRSWFQKDRRAALLGNCRWHFFSGARVNVMREGAGRRSPRWIKSKKENHRRVEEQRMQETAKQQEPSPGEGACETLAQLKLEERRLKKVKEKQQRNKEYVRYIEALRAQMREKIKLYNIDLPPLCSCGSDFWDSHPDTCANNCIFYKNHKAYSHALQSVISSCEPADGSPSVRLQLRDLAALCARSGKHL